MSRDTCLPILLSQMYWEGVGDVALGHFSDIFIDASYPKYMYIIVYGRGSQPPSNVIKIENNYALRTLGKILH